MTPAALRVVGEYDAEGVNAVFDGEFVVSAGNAVVVVAGAASGAVLHQAPVAGLRRVRVVFLVAGLAVPQVLRPLYIGEVVLSVAVADYFVAVTARVDVVDQRFHIHRVACVTVDRVRIVAGDAVFHVGARTAVEFEAVMAGITGVVIDDAALECRFATGGHESDNAVR